MLRIQSFRRVAMGLGLVAGMLFTSAAAIADQVSVLNWQGYGTDEAWALDMFKAETGLDVVHDYFNSEQEMLTKLRTNPGAYDVVLINSAFTSTAMAEGVIQPIDTAGMKNVDSLSPGMRNNASLMSGGKTWGVAWVWGVTSFAVDTGDFSTLPTSINALWDPKNAGRVGWRDDAVEAVQMAAIATGQDINNPSDYAVIRDKLRALKTQIRTFWSSEDDWNQFMSSNEFDLATYWSGSASRSKTAFGLPIEFIIPDEGAIGWLDGLSLATGAPNPEGAKKFIDFMIDPAFYVKWDTDVGAPASANAAANAALPSSAFNKAVLGNPAKVANVQFMGPMSDETREKILELWQETKTHLLD